MATFTFADLSRFQGPCKRVKRPIEIACFSYDDDHKLHLDDRSLSYYFPPDDGVDLTKGFESFKKWDDSEDEHLDSLLASLMDLERREGCKQNVDLVTWRGMMTKILVAPYDFFKDGFSMNATLFQGTIFIEDDHAAKMKRKSEESNKQNRQRPGALPQEVMVYTGYKFEAVATISDTWANTSRAEIEGREDQVVSNYAQYCSVVDTCIGECTMIIGGEVDAVWDFKSTEEDVPTKWVELKTTALRHGDRKGEIAFERKMNRFWAQSFLLGVPKVVVGYRDDSGYLQDMEELDVMGMPGTAKKNYQTWNGNVCINFASEFLSFLKTCINSEGVWKIQREPRSDTITVTRVQEQGTGSILTTEFKEWRQELMANEVAQMLG